MFKSGKAVLFSLATTFLMAALAVVGAICAGAAPAVSHGPDQWDSASIPPEVRSRMHFNARQVPTFPEEDPRLLDLKNWPKIRKFGGRHCELKVTTAYIDGKEPPPRPGFDREVSAYYLCKPRWWWDKVEMLGPHYSWTSYGQLLERGYSRSRGGWLIYQVDRAGRLFGFEDWVHGIYEYFDADGTLIAGEYGGSSLGKSLREWERGLVSLWMGERMSHAEFVARRAKLFRDVSWRY
jgi:hypothetical protein